MVLCGPSGVGKGTIVDIMLREKSDLFKRRISHTSRAPREKEVDGHDYHFTTRDELLRKNESGEMIEIAMVHNNLYGTSYNSVNDVIHEGKNCIIEIDIQGAQSIKNSGKLNACYLFIAPPSIEELERRLSGRGTESREQIEVRLKTSDKEMKFIEDNPNFFDKIFINHDSTQTQAEILSYVLSGELTNDL